MAQLNTIFTFYFQIFILLDSYSVLFKIKHPLENIPDFYKTDVQTLMFQVKKYHFIENKPFYHRFYLQNLDKIG